MKMFRLNVSAILCKRRNTSFWMLDNLFNVVWITLTLPLMTLSQSLQSDPILEASVASSQLLTVQAKATFNMRGIRGSVSFVERPLTGVGTANNTDGSTDLTPVRSRSGLTSSVSIQYQIENLQWSSTASFAKDDVFLVIRQFPVVWNAAGDRCSDNALGKQLSLRFQLSDDLSVIL
jgi:hypothetical protein